MMQEKISRLKKRWNESLLRKKLQRLLFVLGICCCVCTLTACHGSKDMQSFEVPEEFDIIDFQGGIYAVVTDIDQKTDTEFMRKEVDAFLDENGLERDPSRPELGNIITSPAVKEILGYEQMDYYTPVRRKG